MNKLSSDEYYTNSLMRSQQDSGNSLHGATKHQAIKSNHINQFQRRNIPSLRAMS